MIVLIDKGAGAIVVPITVTVFSWYPIVVIFLYLCAGAVIVFFIVVLVDIVEINKNVLGDGVVIVSVIVDDEGAGAIELTYPSFS